ncbi:hypothetical protein [Gloeothece verrucosa]|uniref:hypothetical protein n=1 Tax=Gloeothece verrucosa TaxID=2546359 RepID=UPI0002D88D95
MNSKQEISLILQQDINQNQIGILQPAFRSKDPHHLQRRQQQRAINNDMMKIAILYGRKHKYEWVEVNAYENWTSLLNYLKKVLDNFGSEYVINFV